MIAGFILRSPATVIIRAIGPSLAQYGIRNVLLDPHLAIHNSDGSLIASNDNWQAPLPATFIPSHPNESAIQITLPAGNYTGVVSGRNNTTGTALIELYDLTP